MYVKTSILRNRRGDYVRLPDGVDRLFWSNGTIIRCCYYLFSYNSNIVFRGELTPVINTDTWEVPKACKQ